MKLSDVRALYDVDAYRSALQIDPHQLDDMLMQQPVIQQTVSEMAAEVVSMRDAAKERLSRVDAQAAKTLRKRLMIEEGKVSEARIDREVPLTSEHREAHHVYNELCALAAQWEALRDTVRNRAFVIRDLVSLYTANYFTDTSFRSRSNPQSVQELGYQQARAALAEGRKARRMLSGVPSDVTLRATVDEPFLDAGLTATSAADDDDFGDVPDARPARAQSARNSKKVVAQGVDAAESAADNGPVIKQHGDTPETTAASGTDVLEADDTDRNGRTARATELRNRVRNRSPRRVAEAVESEEGEESGAANAAPESEATDTVDEMAPRRRRHARHRLPE